MLGAAIDDVAVDRPRGIAVQEGKVLPVRLGQLVIEECGVSCSVQLVLLLQEVVPDGIPFRTEAGDRLEGAEPDPRPRSENGVCEGDEGGECRRFLPVGQGLSGPEESRVVLVGAPYDLVAATAIRRLDRRYDADRGILEAGGVLARLEQLAAGRLARGIVRHVEHEGDPPSQLHRRATIGVAELVRDLPDVPHHLPSREGQVATAALPVVQRSLAELRMVGAPVAHHGEGFGEVLRVEGDNRYFHESAI